jgi:hypothetical protein
MGSDVRLFGTDNEGTLVYEGPDDAYFSAFGKIAQVIADKDIYYFAWSVNKIDEIYMMKNNRTLFAATLTIAMEDLRDMETDYGIIPNPKYDEAQQDYITYLYTDDPPVSIPVTVKDTERSAVVLENLCAETYYQVKDVYINALLENKIARDEESIQMLNLIISQPTYIDIVMQYQWGDIFGRLNNCFLGSESVASALESQKEPVNQAMKQTIDAFK